MRVISVIIIFCLGAQQGWSQNSEQQQFLAIQQKIQAGDLRSARADLQRAASRLPGDPRIFNLLGVVEAQENDFAAAESNFQRAIQSAPRFSGAYLNLGRLYQERSGKPGGLESALAVYRKLLAFEPDNIEANYQAAVLLNRVGNYADSLEHIARLPADSKQRPAALALQCGNSAALGRTKQAEVAARELLQSRELSEADVTGILPTLERIKAHGLTLQLLEGLARRHLASAGAYYRMARIHEERGHFKQAREALEKSLESQNPSVALLSQLARVAYRSGDFEGAVAYLAHARDLDPSNAATHFFFGMVCVELKLPPEARKSLQEAVRLKPDEPYYNYALGAVLVNEKNPDQAIQHFQKYVKAKPGDPRGAFALGVAYFDAQQLDKAHETFLSIANHDQTRMGAHLYLGRLAFLEQKPDDALERFQQAIRANPSAPDGYAESALIRIRRGEYVLAEKDLKRALANSPDHYLSNLRLLMLYQRTKDQRAHAQALRVEQLQKISEEKERALLRSLDIRPYFDSENP